MYWHKQYVYGCTQSHLSDKSAKTATSASTYEPMKGDHSELVKIGLEVFMEESRFVMNNEVVLMSSSSLAIHFDQERELDASYWCRVLVKDLDNYSYEHEGDSISTKIEKNDFYSDTARYYPPCERDASLHHSGLTCVKNGKSGNPVTSSTSEVPIDLKAMSRSDVVTMDYTSELPIDVKSISWTDAVTMAVFVGFLIGSLAIVLLLATYSCARHLSTRNKTKILLLKGDVLMM